MISEQPVEELRQRESIGALEMVRTANRYTDAVFIL
jgi:hypothetical protein